MDTIRRPAMATRYRSDLTSVGDDLAWDGAAKAPNPPGVTRLHESPRHGLLRSWGLLLLAVALGLLAAFLGYDRPTPVVNGSDGSGTSVASTGAGAAASSSESSEAVGGESPEAVGGGSTEAAGSGSTGAVVHVVGQVARPGVITLPVGARVADAVEAAGGALPGADLSGVNLARRVNDGEQIAVGVSTAPIGDGQVPSNAGGAAGNSGASLAATGGVGSGQLNLNRATSIDLQELPRVGPVTAEKIIAYREENGPFTSVEQLLEVPGIGEGTLAGLRDLVTV